MLRSCRELTVRTGAFAFVLIVLTLSRIHVFAILTDCENCWTFASLLFLSDGRDTIMFSGNEIRNIIEVQLLCCIFDKASLT